MERYGGTISKKSFIVRTNIEPNMNEHSFLSRIEFTQQIKRLKNNKTPDEDRIKGE